MEVEILTVPYDSGYKNIRMGRGPSYLVENGLVEQIKNRGHRVFFDSIENDSDFTPEISNSFRLNELLSERVRQCVLQKRFPFILSGNCNSCVGIIAGLGSEIGIIWLDNHADMNTPETTTSGFLDGMGLAMSLGLCWRSMCTAIEGFAPIEGNKTIHIGSRNISDKETENFIKTNTTLIESKQIREQTADILTPALESLIKKVHKVYLHLDIDVFDPSVAKANSYQEKDGLTLEDVIHIIRKIKKRFIISACTIVSYDPKYGDSQTLDVITRAIEEIV
ncbi:arginase family protein [Alicyclobacillus sp. SO9]|uniref:arginase family protein n=1 Tax=Alicyclobacillus sp. SO9 TaxID=2665646 RepID=UPI0018E7F5B8|nr:arginase family protein [Alicyclobacillus sp. SO9]QQE78918.1 arginase family protein [Alicyclobacillus sp. SO9]